MPDVSYRRNLPHLHREGFPLFITFRLANSLPAEILHKIKLDRDHDMKAISSRSRNRIYEIEQKHFNHYDEWLGRCTTGPLWLSEKKIADIVSKKILEEHDLRYKLFAYCIMPNHIHMLIEHTLNNMAYHRGKSAKYPVTETLRLLKGSTSRECNLALGRNGQFWHQESYDHIVRDKAELARIVKYILNNPVQAGLVKEWGDWKFTYVNPEIGEW
jgi:REP element-mobilizing transposase RayT